MVSDVWGETMLRRLQRHSRYARGLTCPRRCRPCPSQLHIDCVLFYPHLVDGHIVRQGPAEELARPHIVPGEVPRAYDDMAFELPPGERGPVMPAHVADGVDGPCHVDQQQPLPVGDDHLHLAWG